MKWKSRSIDSRYYYYYICNLIFNLIETNNSHYRFDVQRTNNACKAIDYIIDLFDCMSLLHENIHNNLYGNLLVLFFFSYVLFRFILLLFNLIIQRYALLFIYEKFYLRRWWDKKKKKKKKKMKIYCLTTNIVSSHPSRTPPFHLYYPHTIDICFIINYFGIL